MTDVWTYSQFLRAGADGARKVYGYAHKGLGMQFVWDGSPKGRRPPTWCLYHLNSGHRICLIHGKSETAFPIALEIAELTDWDFDGLDGWRNREPELPAKVAAVAQKYPKALEMAYGNGGNEDTARQIAMARA